ncbi:hypothetical protein [Sphingomonas sp.]|uniref:hypothetical protein n=1 Tax=Sphingomonas sp. TaxID=28214 RepID=UPI001DBDF8C5|nr:hypothetical protein [Sphingomonas sp.]MBX9796820.1 hypothetical protein [Sphingomonas sp.]
MGIDLDGLVGQMVDAGRTAASDIWGQIQGFAIPELKKIAVQIEALADPDSPWSKAEKKLLFKMQCDAAISVIVAMTSLTMLAVERAINAILAAVRGVINGAVGFALV